MGKKNQPREDDHTESMDTHVPAEKEVAALPHSHGSCAVCGRSGAGLGKFLGELLHLCELHANDNFAESVVAKMKRGA